MPEKKITLRSETCPNCACALFNREIEGFDLFEFKKKQFNYSHTENTTERTLNVFCDECDLEIDWEKSEKVGKICAVKEKKCQTKKPK